ncbi:peroxide stress protein YaaA [Paenarthrobacter sp. Z7-10]|uniref:YaaA family protein n=1 Tax=Paenarthrobacter sp. Z7-10 TaxID=2787635 RepID=UPI0022A8F751|nr:peroxide stress protein YaaA [Paenarthrobacter sp. Z7-10]MCZ2403810.1 peroxide stress protein YaaA [Paenarthrobacter sp. Z7-10]
MRILLPPSEGKTAAVKGCPLVLNELSFPELSTARREVISALQQVSGSADALRQLGVGASLAAEVLRNTRLQSEPAAPAHLIYSGVLYDALGYRSLTPIQRRKADAAVVVLSGLWGAIGFADRIPAYRLGMSVGLPGLGRLGAYWKPRLGAALTAYAVGHLLVDCRSSSYAAAWTPPAEQTVAVNVFRQANGKRTVVSHFAKHTRGEVAGHLLTRRGNAPGTPAQLHKAVAERWDAELVPATARKAHQLNLILPG